MFYIVFPLFLKLFLIQIVYRSFGVVIIHHYFTKPQKKSKETNTTIKHVVTRQRAPSRGVWTSPVQPEQCCQYQYVSTISLNKAYFYYLLLKTFYYFKQQLITLHINLNNIKHFEFLALTIFFITLKAKEMRKAILLKIHARITVYDKYTKF